MFTAFISIWKPLDKIRRVPGFFPEWLIATTLYFKRSRIAKNAHLNQNASKISQQLIAITEVNGPISTYLYCQATQLTPVRVRGTGSACMVLSL